MRGAIRRGWKPWSTGRSRESAFRPCSRSAWPKSGPREAALVGLDLAAVLAANGATAELVRVAAEVRPLTRPGVLPPPGRRLVERVLAAVEQGTATVDQIRHAADAVALCWTEPELALGA